LIWRVEKGINGKEELKEENKTYDVNSATNSTPENLGIPLGERIWVDVHADHIHPEKIEAHANKVHGCGWRRKKKKKKKKKKGKK